MPGLPEFREARERLHGYLDGGEVPGAVALVGTAVERALVAAAGVRELWRPAAEVPVRRDTLYDLASLTKVVATLPAVMKLIDAGEVTLKSKVGDFFSNAGWFKSPSLADATVEQLLTHSSGLPAWKPLFAWVDKRETAVANVLQTALEHPPGSYVYSDLGFIVLGAIVERVTGTRLDAFVRTQVFEPLGMTRTSFGPITGDTAGDNSGDDIGDNIIIIGDNIAATEDCGWRNQRLRGVVHDENAYVLGGVAGHAGLFGSADDLASYAQAWLSFDARLASEVLLRLAVTEQLAQGEVRRGLGWGLWTEGSSAGRYASPGAYGHTGFTGTSLWLDPGLDPGLDPAKSWFAVLLTNRVHPSRERGQNIQALRAAFHEAVASAMV